MRMRVRANISSVQTGKRTSRDDAELVKRARAAAIEMMAKAGFKIQDNVTVKVDPKLPIMGYTMPQGQGFTIVVSVGAVGSEMLQALLVHEMSHVYRISTNHPSHNGDILEEAVAKLANNSLRYDYQRKIIHDVAEAFLFDLALAAPVDFEKVDGQTLVLEHRIVAALVN